MLKKLFATEKLEISYTRDIIKNVCILIKVKYLTFLAYENQRSLIFRRAVALPMPIRRLTKRVKIFLNIKHACDVVYRVKLNCMRDTLIPAP